MSQQICAASICPTLVSVGHLGYAAAQEALHSPVGIHELLQSGAYWYPQYQIAMMLGLACEAQAVLQILRFHLSFRSIR